MAIYTRNRVYMKIVDMGKTTILLETQTRDKLRNIGRKSDTYDDIINMLIAIYEKETKIKK